MKIWQKLVLVLGGSSLLLGTVSVFTIKVESKIQSHSEEVVSGMIRENKAAGDMFASIQSIQDLNEKILLESQINSQDSLKLEEYQIQVEFALNQLEKSIIEARKINKSQKLILEDLPIDNLRKQQKINDETNNLENLDILLETLESYREEWNNYSQFRLQRSGETVFYLAASNKTMRESIFPLVRDYYQDSTEEIIESQLHNQKLARENISVIKTHMLLTFVISLILFIYLYDSIYPAIRKLKLATFEMGLNFLEYNPIQPKNPDDELGDLTQYFNKTIEQLKEKIISKSYLDSIINSISQSIIVIDEQNKIQKVNSNVLDILGYAEKDLIGKPIKSIISKNNNLEIDELIKLDDIAKDCFTLDLITKENKNLSVKVYFSDLVDSEGRKRGKICLAIESDSIYLKEEALEKTKAKAKAKNKK
ncbi:MAG: PAS domain S-box protein [Prochloraceae cyanobacterium]